MGYPMMASYSPEEEIEYLKRKNERLNQIVVKAWHIINMLEEKDLPPEIKSAIKTWQFQQSKA